MQLETIGRVTVGDLSLEIRWQVDDVDGTKRTFLWADTTADTQTLRDVGDLGFGGDFDAEFACPDNRTGFLALLTTFLNLVSTRLVCFWPCLLTLGLHCGAENEIVSDRTVGSVFGRELADLVAVDNSNSRMQVRPLSLNVMDKRPTLLICPPLWW